MNNGFRIPTVLAFLLVAGFVGLLSIFSDDARLLLGRAATPPGTIPQSVEIHHVTDSSAVIFWKSSQVVASTLTIPTTSSTFYDVRDTDSIAKPYVLHMYLVQGLPAEKTTSFEIKTGSQTVYQGTLTTGPPLSTTPQAVPLYGSIPKDISGNGVFVKAQLGDVTTLIYSNTPQNWAIPLSTLRTRDLKNYYCSSNECDGDIPITLTFITEEKEVEKQTTLASARPYSDEESESENVLSSISVISPTISTPLVSPSPSKKMLPTQGKEKTTTVATNTPTKPKSSPTLTKPPSKSVLGTAEKKVEIAITSPTNGQALSFTKPLIRGTGIAEKNVTISVSGQITQIGKTKVTDKGVWQWTPAYPLTPGKYSVKIETADENNKKITLTNTFMVLKSGESVLSASTPSATLIPFPTDTPIPTTILEAPTATPTIFVTAGPEMSLFFIAAGSVLLLFALALL